LHDYLAYHEKVWPEVKQVLKKPIYQNITIYRYGFLLVMRITVPMGANLDSMGKLEL
jgi:L-rhamnose mutarotase